MKHLPLLLALLVLSGCMYAEPYPTPVPPQPTPDPVDPVDPPDPVDPIETRYPRSTFDGIVVGADASVLDTLPPPARSVIVGGVGIQAWPLDEKRETGVGYLEWEIHVAGGKVIASFPY